MPPAEGPEPTSVWLALAREALTLCAEGVSRGRQRLTERAAQRWAWERRRLGLQLLRGALMVLSTWTALLLALAAVLARLEPVWWPWALGAGAAAFAVLALTLTRLPSLDDRPDEPPAKPGSTMG